MHLSLQSQVNRSDQRRYTVQLNCKSQAGKRTRRTCQNVENQPTNNILSVQADELCQQGVLSHWGISRCLHVERSWLDLAWLHASLEYDVTIEAVTTIVVLTVVHNNICSSSRFFNIHRVHYNKKPYIHSLMSSARFALSHEPNWGWDPRLSSIQSGSMYSIPSGVFSPNHSEDTKKKKPRTGNKGRGAVVRYEVASLVIVR